MQQLMQRVNITAADTQGMHPADIGGTCSSIFQPSSLSSWQASMDSMAAVATSAALPWMGVLMAALNACPCIKRHFHTKLADNSASPVQCASRYTWQKKGGCLLCHSHKEEPLQC